MGHKGCVGDRSLSLKLIAGPGHRSQGNRDLTSLTLLVGPVFLLARRRPTPLIIFLSLVLAITASTALAAKGGGKGGGGGEPPAGNPAILYVDGTDLMVMDADGGNPRTVLSEVRPIAPNWSPSGTQIVFTAEPITGKGKNRQADPGVYLVNLDGTGFTKLTSTYETHDRPSWSPAVTADGDDWIAFVDTGAGDLPDLFVIRPDGTGRANLTNTASRKERYPTWSPNALAMAAAVEDLGTERQDILTYGIGSTSPGLIIDAEENETNALDHPLQVFDRTFAQLDWARAGDRVALMVSPFGGTPDIWVLDFASPGSSYNLTNTDTEFENSPTWSPDDTRIAFWRQGVGIVAVDADDGTGQSVLASSGIGPAPAWLR